MNNLMWALIKDKDEVGLTLKQVPIAKVNKNDVKIKIHTASICGTDVHIYQWNKWAKNTIKLGQTIGHEYVGEIVEIGENVENFNIGEIVSGDGHIVCGHCRNCLAGNPHLCRNTVGVGVNRDGAFAEYLVVPAKNVWKCNPAIKEELYSCYDPFGNAVHTALAYPLLGEDVLIAGAGPIGCLAAAICAHAGARHIVVSDVNEYRLDLAKTMGATRTVNVTKEKIKDVMLSLNMKEGFDVGLEMSGSTLAINDMIDVMNNGGKIALLGILDANTTIDWEKVIFNQLTIKGIYGRKMWDSWYKMDMMIESGLPLEKIITHRFDFKDFQQGFDVMLSGQSGKVILDFSKISDIKGE